MCLLADFTCMFKDIYDDDAPPARTFALHTCLCPAFQSDTWHSREQYLTLPQLEHVLRLCGEPHAAHTPTLRGSLPVRRDSTIIEPVGSRFMLMRLPRPPNICSRPPNGLCDGGSLQTQIVHFKTLPPTASRKKMSQNDGQDMRIILQPSLFFPL